MKSHDHQSILIARSLNRFYFLALGMQFFIAILLAVLKLKLFFTLSVPIFRIIQTPWLGDYFRNCVLQFQSEFHFCGI